jgi:CTP:phosphocholine cytidylyltransferase-like protein
VTSKVKQVSSVATTNEYAALITVAVPPQIGSLLLYLKEENTNAIMFKIQGAQDENFTYYEDLKSETTLAKNGETYETISEPWLFVRVLHKAASEGSQGKTTCIISGSGGS